MQRLWKDDLAGKQSVTIYLFRLSGGGGSVGWIILIIDAHTRTDDWVDGIKNDGYV